MERLTVLDKGWIQLEDCMGGDEAVVRGARICYQSKARGPEADTRLIRRLMKSDPKHNTVFEHAVFRERSLRYCAAAREFYVPSDEPCQKEYVQHMEASFDLYETLVTAGWSKERARAVLGTGVYTEFIWTVNAWSLMNWLLKRCHKSAQWEHRQYALAALTLYEEEMPITAGAFREFTLEPGL